jgi:hypothetical protein
LAVYKPYGYRYGPIIAAHYLVDTTVMAALTIDAGDMIFMSATAAGYVVTATAADAKILGVAMEKAAIGATEVLVNCSKEAVYEYPTDTGSITVAYKGLLCAVGGAQSVNFDDHTADVLRIHDVDTTNNTVFVKINIQPGG